MFCCTRAVKYAAFKCYTKCDNYDLKAEAFKDMEKFFFFCNIMYMMHLI